MNDVVVSGAFDWDRSWPRKKGGKFYCSPFRLAFTISKPVPPSVWRLFKRLGYRECILSEQLGAHSMIL